MMVAVNLQSTQPNGYPRVMLDGDPAYATSGGAELGINATNNPGPYLQWCLYTSSNGRIYVQDPAPYQSWAGQWVLLVGTYNGSTMTLYRNGAAIASTSASGTVATPSGYTVGVAGLGSGGGGGGGQACAGFFAEAAIWAGTALTAAQVSQLWTDFQTLSESAFEQAVLALSPSSYWPMQDTSGTTAANAVSGAPTGTYEGTFLLGQPGGTGQPVAVTVPPAPTAVTLTSGTAWQNTTGADVWLTIPVTYNPTSTGAATLAVGCGPTSAPAQSTWESLPAGAPAGTVRPTCLYVPVQWYVLLTATNATLGTGSMAPV
jgi:hypothetical protein